MGTTMAPRQRRKRRRVRDVQALANVIYQQSPLARDDDFSLGPLSSTLMVVCSKQRRCRERCHAHTVCMLLGARYHEAEA